MRKTALIITGAAIFNLGVVALADISAEAQDRTKGGKAGTERAGGFMKIEGIAGESRRIDGGFNESDCNKAGGKVRPVKGDKYCELDPKKAKAKIKDKNKD